MSRFTRFLSALGVNPRDRVMMSGAGLSQNTIVDPDSQAFRPTKGKQLENTFGAVGTLNFSGYLTDLDEYNSDFQVNTEVFKIYEQMRRGDSQVFALLCTLGLPITSARWDVSAPEAAPKNIEKEAADLVRENLFGGLEYVSPGGMRVSQSWPEVLRHALLILPFGCAAMEEIWEVDGDTIRLARLAPRMPSTYWRWHVDTDGETLMVLEQHAYRGADLQFWKIPADKITLFNFQQEGAYFAGRALLRAAYPPWFYKNGFQRTESIAAEHNAMGIAVGTHAPNADPDDRRRFNDMLQRFSVHESTSFGLPNGADFKLVGVTGSVFDCNAAIGRYNQEITRVGLAAFLDLGTTAGASGSKALGTTLSDFFYMAEQSLAVSIAGHLNNACVRRIVDFNYPGKFGRGLARYPRVTVANVQSRSITAILEYLDKLATANLVTPDDTLEESLREQLGFPKADPTTRREVAQTKVTETLAGQMPGAAPAPGAPPAAPAPAAPAPSAPAAAPTATPGAGKEPTTEQPEPGKPEMSAAGGGLRRAPRGAEIHVEHQQIIAALDGGAAAIAGAIRGSKPEMLRQMAQTVAAASPRAIHRAAMPGLDKTLAGALRGKLEQIYQAGRASVEHERASQRASAPIPAPPVQLDATGADSLQLIADTTVGLVQNQLGARAKSAGLAAQRGGSPPDAAQVASDVDDQADGWIDRAAAEATHQAFANGRQDGFAEHRDEIDHFLYSAMLDMNTCDNCAAADGKEGSENDLPEVPNADCSGGDQCRCMWVAIFKDEGGAA